ncbi:MAG: phosphoribosyl-AMP cyclohydrolase [Pseudomonadota bacterium]
MPENEDQASNAPADLFGSRDDPLSVERGRTFAPKFDRDKLIPAVVTERGGGMVLMFAYMNPEALRLSIETGEAHFFSRSRNTLWKKGEESGNTLRIATLRTDCDQDVVWLEVEIAGDGVACHTGAKSCFYRQVPLGPIGEPPIGLSKDE